MSRSMMVRPLMAAVVVVVVTLGVAAVAVAGEYRVYSCKTPSGMVAPTDGWAADRGNSVSSEPSNYCPSGGPLVAELNRSFGQPANTGIVTWGWSAPSGASIAAYRIWRSANVLSAGEPNATPWVFSARPLNQATGTYIVDNCVSAAGCSGLGSSSPGLAPASLLAEDLRSMGPVTAWFINAACGGITGQYCMPRAGVMSLAQVHAAEFTLRDPEGPTASNQTGRMTGSTSHSGIEVLSFSAADAVSGVYRVFLEIDGKTVRTAAVDANDGRCADAGVDPATPYEFLYREPCRKSVQYDLSLDTRTLTDGTHALKVSVEDASGNRTSVLSAPEFVVKNAGTGAGTGGSGGADGTGSAGAAAGGGTNGGGGVTASACNLSAGGITARFTRTDATRVTVRHGGAFTIKGRAPANADIDVFHVRGSKITALGSVRTTAGGTFRDTFRARHGGGAIQLCGPGVATSLTLRVKAKVAFRVKLSRYGLVRYSGRVATGQIPKGGKIVAIQGKAGSSWQTFALRRTDRKGRFKGRYRLRVVIPGTKLKFRVRVPSEAGYPFVGVVSKSVTKRVR